MKITKRRLKNLMNYLIVVLILFMLVSCSLETSIVGKWNEIDGNETMEFFKDGTVSVNSGYVNTSGSYSLVDNDRIKLTFNGLFALAGPVVADISVHGDEMAITMPNGKTSKYKRAK